MKEPTASSAEKPDKIVIGGRAWSLPLLVVVFFTLFLISQTAIALIIQPLGGADVLRLQTVFSANGFSAIVADWESRGLLGYYYLHFIPDFLHPLWYGLFLYFLLRLVLAHAAGRVLTGKIGKGLGTVLLVLGPAAAGLDLIENVVHLLLLHSRGLITPFSVFAVSLISSLKWLCALAALLAALFLSFWIKFTGRRKSR